MLKRSINAEKVNNFCLIVNDNFRSQNITIEQIKSTYQKTELTPAEEERKKKLELLKNLKKGNGQTGEKLQDDQIPDDMSSDSNFSPKKDI